MKKSTSSKKNRTIDWVHCYCWFYQYLSTPQKVKFEVLLGEFLNSSNFIGSGIDLTEEMKVAIGGWAVLLVLNRPLNIAWYRNIESIVVFPGAELKSQDALGLMISGSHYCHIHLAWGEVRDSSTKFEVRGNTILHEFAHALDHLNRSTDGQPSVLLSKDELDLWKRVFNQEYIHKQPWYKRKKLWVFFELGKWNAFDSDDSSCLDVAELFAISTELFFERPLELHRHAPDIYECLTLLYKFNPLNDFMVTTKRRKIWEALFTKK